MQSKSGWFSWKISTKKSTHGLSRKNWIRTWRICSGIWHCGRVVQGCKSSQLHRTTRNTCKPKAWPWWTRSPSQSIASFRGLSVTGSTRSAQAKGATAASVKKTSSTWCCLSSQATSNTRWWSPSECKYPTSHLTFVDLTSIKTD